MPSLQRLYGALKQADADNNAEDAKIIVGMIKREEQNSRVNQEPEPTVAPTEAAPVEKTERTFGGTLKDIGISALSGAIGLPQSVVGLLDIPTGGAIGKGLESLGYRPEEAKKFLKEEYSPAQKEAFKQVSEAKGFIPTLQAAVRNPSTILQSATESIPQMLGGMGIARGVMAAAPKLSAAVAGGLGEGMLGAGSAAEQIREESPDKLLAPLQSLAALGSGAGTAAFGILGGKIAGSKLGQRIGLNDVDTMLARGGAGAAEAGAAKAGFIRSVIGSGISEGVLEELPQSMQEKMWQNWATNKPLMEGVSEAGAMGLITGAAVGAVGGGYGNLTKIYPAQPPPPPPEAPQIDPDKYGAVIKGLTAAIPDSGLTDSSKLGEIFKAFGIENEAEVSAYLNQAITSGEIVANSNPVFNVTDANGKVLFNTVEKAIADKAAERLNAEDAGTATVAEALATKFTKPTGMPQGVEVRTGQFKQDMFNISRGDTVLNPEPLSAEEVGQKAYRLSKITAGSTEANTKEIEALQKKIDTNNTSKEKLEAAGEALSPEYATLSAQVNENNALIQAQIDEVKQKGSAFSGDISITPAKESDEGFTLFKQGKPAEYFKTKEDLNQALAAEPTAGTTSPKPEALDAAREALREKLLPFLKKVGLENTGLRIMDSIENGQGSSDGAYAEKLIFISMQAANPMGALRHETIHALKELGAFTKQEWSLLESYAKKQWVNQFLRQRKIGDSNYYDTYKKIYLETNPSIAGFDEYIIEEAIADAFKYFNATKPPANIIGNIYRKVKALLEGLGNQLSGLGFQTADDVFKRVEAGQMKPTRQAETGAAPRYALNPKQKEAALIKSESVPLAIVSANPGAGRYEQGNFSYKGTTVDEATQDFAKLASGLVTKYAAENSGEESTSKWERVAKDRAADELGKNGVQLLRDYYKRNKVSESDISEKTSGLSNVDLSKLFEQIRGSINADFGSTALPSYLQRTAKVGDKTANQINKENIHAKAVELLQKNKKWIAKEFGLKNFQFQTVRGSFEGNPELSFAMTADNMTTDVANKLSLFLGVGFVQDQVVHRIPIDVTDENQFVIPSAIITNKNLSKISEEDATRFITAAKKVGLDYTEAVKGDGFVFHYFGDKSEIGDWNQTLQKISQESGLNNVISFNLSSDLYDANLPKGYTSEGREEGSGEDRSKDATTGSPVYAGSSWKLLVDKFLAPYVKSISGEGYRVSPDRFALRYGLNEAQTQYLREALYPKSAKGSVAPVLYDGEIVNVLPSKSGETKPSISDVGSILANRSTVQGQVEPGDHSEKARKAVAAVFADEVKRRIERENIEGSPESLKKAQGWYEKTLKIALEKMSSIFPELSVDAKGNPTNKQARFLFNGILAITSQGMDVVANFKAAATYYGSIRRAETNFLTFGKINPQHAPNLLGDKHNAIEWNLKKFQEIIDELGGWKEAEALMLNKSTVKELNKLVSTKLKNLELYNDEGKLAKVKVAGAAERVSRGWSLFGPKIGSFANNLYGDFSTLTADLWFSRTWNRVLGFVYRKDATLEAKQMMAFRSAIEKEFSDTWRQSGSGEWKLTKHGLDEVFRYDRAAKSVVEKEKDMAALQDSASRDYNAASDKLKNIEEKWKSEGFSVNKKINSDPALAKIYADLKEIKRQEKLKMSLKKGSDSYKRDVARINKEKKQAVNTQKSHFSWIGNSLPEKIQENLNGDPDNLFDFASALHTEYAGAQFYRRTPLNAAAKNFFENSSKLVAAPRSVSEGLFQQEVIEESRDILKNELGINVEIADLQALLWFQEKDIYRKFGAANSKAAPADYSDAASQTIASIKNGNLNIEEKSYISPSLKKVGGKQSLQDTVYIDGVNRPTTDSRGRPIFNTLEGIKNFWRGFGDSAIVDKDGKPMLMYHGTTPPEDSEGIFSQFRSSDDGKMGKGIYTTSIEKYAESFAPSGAVMPIYISMSNPFYINLSSKVIEGKSARTLLREQISGESKDTFDKNYFRLDSAGSKEINNALNNEIQSITDGKRLMDMSGISIQRALKKAGYDGIVVKDSEGNFVEVNAFDSEQIKSATGNRGTFSPKSKDIRYSLSDPAKIMDDDLIARIGEVEGLEFVKQHTAESNGVGRYGVKAIQREYKETIDAGGEVADMSNNVIYGKGGYNRYQVADDGTVRPIASSFDNRTEELRKAREILSGVPRYSLRDDFITKFGQADLTNLNSKTHVREEVGFAKRLAAAISPDSRVKLRAQLINRLEAIERQTMKVSVDPRYAGYNELLADVSATAAALQSQRASGIAAESFKRGVPVYAKGFTSVSDLNGTVKGLIPIFEPLLNKYKDPMIWQIFQFYSATRRGERFAGEGREKLFTKADFQKGRDYGIAYPEFDAVFKDYQKYNEALVKFQVDTGVLTPEMGRKWMIYSDYIPFYRQINGEETLGPKLFQNFSGVKPTPILKGSDVKIADFLETIILNSRSAIENGMKNVASQRIARDAMRTNSPGMTDMARKLLPYEKDAADVIHVRENGVDVRYKVADILLVEAMKGLGTTEMGSVLKFMSYPTKVLRDLVTKDPGFMLANLFRDSAQAYVTSGVNMIPIIDTFKQAAKILANQSPEAKALMAAGIGGGYEFSGDVKASAKAVSAALNEKAGIKTGWQKALWPVSKVWSALEAGTTASDLATRSEIYARVMKSTNGNEAEAVYQALEVMNYGRMGSNPIIQVVSALVPFFNARVQGLDVLYRAGTGRLASASAKTQQKLFARRAMYIMGMSIAYWMLARDTDEWKRASKETRDNNWIIGSVKVPIPFEIGTIFKVLPERILEYTFGNDTGADLADSAGRNILSTLKMNPIPQAMLPLVEAYWIDYSFFTGNPVIGRGMEKLDPQFQLREGTSLVAKKMGDLTGMSPMKIDHVLQGYTGAMGMYAASAISAMIRTEDDGAKASMSLEQTPILKRFFASDKAGGSIDAFYEFKKQVDMVVATQDELQKRGNPEQYIEYMKTNGKLLGAKQIVSNIGDKLSEMRKLRNIVNFSKSMPPDQKRETLDNIRMAEIKLTESIKGIRAMVTQ